MSLRDLFYDPKTGLGSTWKFIQIAKKHGFSAKEVAEFLKRQAAPQILKDRQPHVFFPNWGRGDGSYQMDLFFPGSGTLLTIINVNSRKLYAYPVKSKELSAIYPALEKWLKEVVEPPHYIQSDNEKAFQSAKVRGLFKDHGIEQAFVEPGDHRGQGMVERAHETLRRLFTMYETAFHKPWKGALDDLIYNYNHRINRSINQEPAEATEDAGMLARSKQYAEAESAYGFKVGDNVRLAVLDENPFTKGRKRWSNEVWSITGSNGFHRYILNDPKKSCVLGYDLQLVQGEPEHAPEITEPPLDKEPVRKEKKTKRALNKEGIKDFLAPGKADEIESDKRIAKNPEIFEAKPANRKDLKERRTAEAAKVKKQGPRIHKYVQKFQNGIWIRGKVFGDRVKYLDGSTGPYSKDLYKFPTDKADKKAFTELEPQLEALG